MKTLIILSAKPASGKSTWAKAYEANHQNVKIISSDQVRLEVTGSLEDHTRQDEVWALFDKRIKEYAQIPDVTVILDALNDKNVLRQKYVLENQFFDKYVLVLFDSSEKDCLFYNATRQGGARVPDSVMHDLFNKFESVDEKTAKLFDEIYQFSWQDKKEVRIK